MRRKVLLILESGRVLPVRETLLARRDIGILHAEDGHQALQLIREKPAVVVLDLELLSSDQLQQLVTEKKAYEVLTVPIVVISDHIRLEKVPVTLLSDCAAILPQSVSVDELVERIVSTLRVPTRSSPRVPIFLQVEIHKAKPFFGQALDLSPDGMKIHSDEPLDLDDQIHVTFALTDVNRIFSCYCRVVRACRDEETGKVSYGIQFLDLSPEEKSAIRSVIP